LQADRGKRNLHQGHGGDFLGLGDQNRLPGMGRTTNQIQWNGRGLRKAK